MNQKLKTKGYLLNKIGIMQGRLTPKINNKMQCFPFNFWKSEFRTCSKLNIKKIEWIIDNYKFQDNPICTFKGRQEIYLFKNKYHIKIVSITANFFMQKPFYKIKRKKDKNYSKLKNFIIDASKINIKYIILPLLDNASICNIREEKELIKYLNNLKTLIKSCNIIILFESDYPPKKLLRFIKKFDEDCFGINYDLGNSAGLGYDFNDEKIYFDYVKNIHIKDRNFQKKSVRLGKGNAQFDQLFKYLIKSNYKGNLILETARHKQYKYTIKKDINFLHKKLINL